MAVKKFKVGALVTGVDRSYRRSIYQVVNTVGHLMTLRFICIDGQHSYSHGGKHQEHLSERLVSDFRLATKKEVFYELGFAHRVFLITFIKKLLKVKRSYLGRRSLD